MTAGQPAVAGTAGVGRDHEAGTKRHGSPQAGAKQVERRRISVLTGLVGRDQREALALKLGEVVDALKLVELEGRAVGKAPDVAGGVVRGSHAVDEAEHLPRGLLEVDDAGEALADEEHAGSASVLLGVAEHEARDGVGLAAASAAAEEQVAVLGRQQHAFLKGREGEGRLRSAVALVLTRPPPPARAGRPTARPQ